MLSEERRQNDCTVHLIKPYIISSIMVHLNGNTKLNLNEDLIRHISLNCLRSFNKQFKTRFGNMIICCDSKRSWRKDVFPFYKFNRRKNRETSSLDWTSIFEILNKIRDEIKENLPYRVLEVEGAEADDIIGVLTSRFSPSENILILSSDKDFIQLQKYRNVQQYSPILKRFLKTENPQMFIKEHIIRGDTGDGIPNFLSSDNTFAIGERQKRINKNRMIEWINNDPEVFCVTDSMKHGYHRNKMLVDLDCIPRDLQARIVTMYDDIKPKNKTIFLNYLIKNKLKNLIEIADEF